MRGGWGHFTGQFIFHSHYTKIQGLYSKSKGQGHEAKIQIRVLTTTCNRAMGYKEFHQFHYNLHGLLR